MTSCRRTICFGGDERELGMGTIIEFPASRQPGSRMHDAPLEGTGTVLILPVVRIERQTDETSGGSGPAQGAANSRRRRR
jgi:hypothetical protein